MTGCAGSRWARSDAEYELKYPEHSSDVLQTLKQSIDARFIGGRDGYYVSVGGGDEPTIASGEIGKLLMVKPWLESRFGLVGLAGSPNESLYGGGNLGIRAQLPSRLAPFVGFGGYAGMEPWRLLDVNQEDFLQEPDRQKSEFTLTAYPEVGLHFWVTPEIRMTGSASYYLGWGDDAWLFSFAFSRVPGQKSEPRQNWKDWTAESWLPPAN